MSNAERQAAWRARREQRLRDLTECFDQEVERRAAEAVPNIRREAAAIPHGAGDTNALELRIAELENEALEAQRRIKTLRTVTGLSRKGAAAILEPFLAELEQQGRTNAATLSLGAVFHAAGMIEQRLDDWREIGDGAELFQRCRAPLKVLHSLRRRRAHGQIEINSIAKAAIELRRRIEGDAPPIPDFDPAKDGVFERQMIDSMRDQLRAALARLERREEEVKDLRHRNAQLEAELVRQGRELTNALKDVVMLKQAKR